MRSKHKQEGPFRVFVTRHYIAVRWYDVDASSEAEARRMAERAAREEWPDVRATATDNGWHADDPTPIPKIGHPNPDSYRLAQAPDHPGVFRDPDPTPRGPRYVVARCGKHVGPRHYGYTLEDRQPVVQTTEDVEGVGLCQITPRTLRYVGWYRLKRDAQQRADVLNKAEGGAIALA